MMTYQRAAELSIECQDACNLSGVLSSFKTAVHEAIWPEARRLEKGTDWVNRHPICYLFLYKLSALNGHEPFQDWPEYDRMEAEVKAILAADEVTEVIA